MTRSPIEQLMTLEKPPVETVYGLQYPASLYYPGYYEYDPWYYAAAAGSPYHQAQAAAL